MPRLLQPLTRPGAAAFLAMFTLDSMARALLITVIPLQAYALLADAQLVSVLYFGAGAVGLCGALSVPWLVRAVGRRGALVCGSLCLAVAVVLFSLQELWSVVACASLSRSCCSACRNSGL